MSETRNRSTLYLETTIPSYLEARPSTDMIILTHQHLTQEWWRSCLQEYDITKLAARLQESQKRHGEKLVTRSAKRIDK